MRWSPRSPIAAWWGRRSLRVRLTSVASLVIAAGLAGAAVLLVAWLHASLIGGLDQTALQRAQIVAGEVNAGRLTAALPASTQGDTAVQIVGRAGAVRASTANLSGEPRLFTFPAANGQQPRSVTFPLGENQTWRAVAVPARTGTDRATVYVAVPTTDVDRSLAQLSVGLASGVPVVVALLAGVVWWLTGRALQPVDLMRAQASDITASDLDRRLDVPLAHDVLSRLATTLNDLLARLDTATRQQRQFIADAAHELRNPLSAMRTELEVAVRHPESTRWHLVAPSVLEESERLSRLVDDLVQLAYLDSRPEYRHEPVDLDEIIFTEVRRARQRKPLIIDERAVGAARVSGDAGALTRVVRNLLDNAVRYARSRIDVRLSIHGRTAYLTIADDGPGIPEADRQRVLERFTRLDDARARETGGSGLGLAIVHDIVAAHHGDISIECNDPGTRVIVRLPTTNRLPPL